MSDITRLVADLSPVGVAEVERLARRIVEREVKEALLPTTGKEIAVIFDGLSEVERVKVAKFVVGIGRADPLAFLRASRD